MKRVIFGKVHENFNFKTHIPFGPWCFIGCENKYKWQQYRFPEDAFKTKHDFQQAAQNVDSIINYLFPVLCDYLNKVNGVRYSDKFWQIMAMPWLSLFVQNIITSYYRLKGFLDGYSTDFIFECSPKNNPIFENTLDFIQNGIRNIDYNEGVYYHIICNCFPNLNVDKRLQRENISRFQIPIRNSYKFKLKFFLKDLLAIKSVYGISVRDSVLLSLFVKRVKNHNRKKTSFKEKISSTFLAEMEWESFAISCLPKCFLNINNFSVNPFAPTYHFKIVSGSLLYTEEEQKYKLASYVEKGGTIVTSQHGSNYGVLSTFLWIKHVEYRHSHYISWGWKDHQGLKTGATPLPSPLIEQFRNHQVEQEKKSDILLIGTTTSPFYTFIGTFHQPNQVLEYRDDKLFFLTSLSQNCFNRIKYRYYPVDETQLLDKEYVQARFPKIKLCDGNLNAQMGQASLIVSDHPGTTFNLTMGANVPTIGFWNPEHWGFTEEAEELFFKLKQQKIIFDTPKEAADHINQIANNIPKWWNSTKVQKARSAWSDKYARASKNWKKDWKRAIKKLNEEIVSH